MSQIRYALKALLPSLSAQANQIKEREIKQRYYLLKKVAESPKAVSVLCLKLGYSTDYFYKWAKILISTGDLESLASRSRAPKVNQNKTSDRITRKIKRIRKKLPFLGPERISHRLKVMHKMRCAPSTVGAILKREKLVDKAYSKRCTKKHLKRYRRPIPGYLQLDIKYVPYLVEGRQLYQFSAIDHHSSFRFIETYKDRSLPTVIDFLEGLEFAMPFQILQIQTDNAAEFTDKYSAGQALAPTGAHDFDLWCEQREINHRLIPIGEKELNGKVENSHRWDDREFYSQIDPQSFEELRLLTKDYNERWNFERPTKVLSWLTPQETLEAALVRLMAQLLNLKGRCPQPVKEEREIVYTPLAIIEQTKPKPVKKVDFLRRYLLWDDWDRKTPLKSALLLPSISMDYSHFFFDSFARARAARCPRD